MTGIIQIAAFILITAFLVFLCIRIGYELRHRKERVHIRKIRKMALSLKENIAVVNTSVSKSDTELKKLSDFLDTDETKIKSCIVADTRLSNVLANNSDTYFSAVNDFISGSNFLRDKVSRTRSRCMEIISQLERFSLRDSDDVTEIRGILGMTVRSCDNTDEMIAEAYILAEKARTILQLVRKNVS